MNKTEKILGFNPNAAGLTDSNIYGLPFTEEESDIILIPVPWEVTTSYGAGTSNGPAHILEASFQVDLFHQEFPTLWKSGIAMIDIPEDMLLRSVDLKQKASQIIEMWEDGIDVPNDEEAQKIQEEINDACIAMNAWVKEKAKFWMDKGKLVGLVGGDHSTPLGLFQAQAEAHESFGILHIDAHKDLRIAYEGFQYSHASIMHNALKISAVEKIVQVGIRDFCEEEKNVADAQGDRLKVHTYSALQKEKFKGSTWHQQCEQIVDQLPTKVHISFDIDGLDPSLCPNTGTPVAGGFEFSEVNYIFKRIVASGRQIIGFDVVETGGIGNAWDGNVGARVVYKLASWMAKSNQII